MHNGCQKFKAQVQKHWEITDMGNIQWYLGFEIRQKKGADYINQSAHIYRVNGIKIQPSKCKASHDTDTTWNPTE